MTLALTFPGQGSQAVGMLAGYGDLPAIRDTFAEASAVLGQDLLALVTDGPEEQLNATINTQPVMLAAGVAVYRAWRDLGGAEPAWLAGHSLGEYSALVVAGALEFRDALPLVRFRAEAMQSAVPEGVGAMAAILGLDEAGVRAACSEAEQGQVVAAVNLNAPGQVVIAGDAAAVARAIETAKARGAKKAMALPVSVPSHCALMRPAAERLASRLSDIPLQAPRIPVIHNADVAAYTEPDAIRQALVRQLYSPVRWVETVEKLAAAGATHIFECGPGKVLLGMNKRIAKAASNGTWNDRAALDAALAQ